MAEKKKEIVLNIRQKKAIELLLKGGTTWAAILKEAGYSPSICNSPSRVHKKKNFKAAVGTIIERMEEEREKALKAMAGKRDTASYAELAATIDKFTKNIQLLGGKSTENLDHTFNWQE